MHTGLSIRVKSIAPFCVPGKFNDTFVLQAREGNKIHGRQNGTSLGKWQERLVFSLNSLPCWGFDLHPLRNDVSLEKGLTANEWCGARKKGLLLRVH